MSKFGAIIEQAKSQNAGKPENKKTVKQENPLTGKPEKKTAEKTPIKDVNLSIKVPEFRRRHWVSEAKRQGTSLTAVILESLSKRFGEPE